MPQTGSTRLGDRRRRPPARRGRSGTSSPAARRWTSSARIATAISRCEVWPRSSPTGTRTRSSRCCGTPAVGERAEHRLAPLAGGDQPDERREGRHRLLDRLLVAVALGGDDDDGAGVELGGGEVRSVVDVGPPAQRPGQVGEGVRHRRAADDDQVRGRDDRFDVDLQGALALAGDRDGHHPVRHGRRRTAPACRAAAASAPARRSPAAPRGPPPARRRRRRSSRRAGRVAVMSARAPCWPDDGPCRHTTVASANSSPRRDSSAACSRTSQPSTQTSVADVAARRFISRPSSPAARRTRRGAGSAPRRPGRAAAACRCCGRRCP